MRTHGTQKVRKKEEECALRRASSCFVLHINKTAKECEIGRARKGERRDLARHGIADSAVQNLACRMAPQRTRGFQAWRNCSYGR